MSHMHPGEHSRGIWFDGENTQVSTIEGNEGLLEELVEEGLSAVKGAAKTTGAKGAGQFCDLSGCFPSSKSGIRRCVRARRQPCGCLA